MINDAVAW